MKQSFTTCRLIFLTLICGLISSINSEPVSARDTVEVYGRTMGPIPYRVRVVVEDDPQPEKLKAIKSTVSGSLERVNQLMSTYIDDSDISKFNAANSTDWQSVDSETVAVVARALEISRQTDGAFDPTVAPAVNLWNFGPNKKEPTLPSADAIESIQRTVGYQKINFRLTPPAIRKSNPQTQLDLSAIAKGYAVDRVSKSLTELGYRQHMVEVGGEVLAKGERGNGGPWRVEIERPVASKRDPRGNGEGKIIEISDRAVATSGNYRNYVTIDGKRFAHTIDPKTCRPVLHDLATASVAAEDCMTADAIATAVMVLGSEKGHAVCRELGLAVLTIDGSPENASVADAVVSGDYPAEFQPPPTIIPTAQISVTDETADDSAEANRDVVKTKAESKKSILPAFLGAFVIFALAILGMAFGAIFNNKPVTGSCGGLANMTNADGDEVCGVCSKPTTDCVEKTAT